MCRKKREWERASRKLSLPCHFQQCPLGLSVPWSPLWWWVQPGSLPKSLFYAPSLARGEGRVESHRVTCSGLGLVVIRGLPWDHARQIPLESSVLFVTWLAQFALVWWHTAVEGCCKKYQGQNWNFPCFCNVFSHKDQGFLQQLSPQSGCSRHIPLILLTLSLQVQIWSISPYKMNQWNCWRCLWKTGFSCSTNEMQFT